MSEVVNKTPAATEVAVADAMLKPRISGEALALAGKAKVMLQNANAYVIVPGDADSYTRATEMFKSAGTAVRQLDDIRLTHTRPIDAMKSAVMDFFRSPGENAKEAKRILADKISAEDARIEHERKLEEARLRAAQREEEERQRREAAELRRAAEEAEAAAAARAAAALEAEGAGSAIPGGTGEAAEARAQSEALALEEARELREAAEIAEAAADAAMEPVALAPAPRKAAGVSKRVNYSAEVVDLRALVEAWLAGKAPEACIVPNESYLNGQARLDKDAFALPGCKLVKARGLGG